jgi:hypothetical protein
MPDSPARAARFAPRECNPGVENGPPGRIMGLDLNKRRRMTLTGRRAVSGDAGYHHIEGYRTACRGVRGRLIGKPLRRAEGAAEARCHASRTPFPLFRTVLRSPPRPRLPASRGAPSRPPPTAATGPRSRRYGGCGCDARTMRPACSGSRGSTAGRISSSRAAQVAASRGDDALGGLAAGMGVASLLMAAGCAWGLSRRIAEYR